MIEAEHGHLRGDREQDAQGRSEDQKRRNEAHQRSPPRACLRDWLRPPRPARERAARCRSFSPAMILPRSSSLIPLQAAISATVRPQPTHSADNGSTTQIWTQGVEIGGMVFI